MPQLSQGGYFRERDFNKIAIELDRKERSLLQAGGAGTSASGRSSYVDQNGNYSVDVIRVALAKARLDLVRVGGDQCRKILGSKPLEEAAEGIIVGTGAHWFSLRKLRTPSSGGSIDWYNVDSCLQRGP